MSKILIIEDEAPILLGLEDALQAEGYEVLSARNGETGLAMGLEGKADLILLDIMLPKLSGFDLIQKVREKHKTLPIIMLTARGRERDKVRGFELGADDYITKPFSLKELIARIKAVLRRAPASRLTLEACKLEGIHFDFTGMKAARCGKELDFSARELELLQYLMMRKGELVSRDDLLQDLWHYAPEQIPTTRTIDNYVVKLRHKIEKDPEHPKHILTIHGRGYRFEA